MEISGLLLAETRPRQERAPVGSTCREYSVMTAPTRSVRKEASQGRHRLHREGRLIRLTGLSSFDFSKQHSRKAGVPRARPEVAPRRIRQMTGHAASPSGKIAAPGVSGGRAAPGDGIGESEGRGGRQFPNRQLLKFSAAGSISGSPSEISTLTRFRESNSRECSSFTLYGGFEAEGAGGEGAARAAASPVMARHLVGPQIEIFSCPPRISPRDGNILS